MKDIILDTLFDSLKLLPFLFIAFFIIEIIEHKLSKKSEKLISKAGNVGPLMGAILGLFPQCGFSVLATNLYVTRIISLGTLISIYLSTSDEMLPILLTRNVLYMVIVKLLLIKFVIGMTFGFIIDLIYRKKYVNKNTNYEICDKEHCHCNKGILHSTIKHTLNTILYIFIISFILNTALHFGGEKILSNVFLSNSFLGPFISSLVGLIPNCGASIMITELYLNNALSLGSAVAGLLSGSGLAILVLFKSNKNLKENFIILSIVYFIGVVCGIIINLLGNII